MIVALILDGTISTFSILFPKLSYATNVTFSTLYEPDSFKSICDASINALTTATLDKISSLDLTITSFVSSLTSLILNLASNLSSSLE